MQQIGLLKKLLPGLLPILIFIVADEIWGTQVGLVVAVIIGVIQLIYFIIKEKRLEKFVLFDTLLIIAMGGVSIILENDIFFKLKPAIIEVILVTVLAYSYFSKHNILMNMSKRYMKDMEISEAQNQVMRKSLRNMLFILLPHLLLTIYASFWMSTEAWAFISTALLYILLFGYFGLEFLIRYLKNKNTEYLPVVDKDGKLIGKASREECHKNPALIYPVVRLHLFNPKREILLQKRSLKSDIEPGKWDAAVAGHVHFGEEIDQALKRECLEELNYSISEFQLIDKRIFQAESSTALMFVFVGMIDESPKANLKEVEEVSFFRIEELKPLIIKEKTTKGLEQELPILQQIKKQIK